MRPTRAGVRGQDTSFANEIKKRPGKAPSPDFEATHAHFAAWLKGHGGNGASRDVFIPGIRNDLFELSD